MFRHEEQKFIPYAKDDVMDIVLNVKDYPDFLPWCKAARINSHEPGLIMADLIVGFASITETFTSKVEYDKDAGTLRTNYVSGPLQTMRSEWVFEATDDGCNISFYVELAFQSSMLSRFFAPLFEQAITKMVGAFVARADAVLPKISA